MPYEDTDPEGRWPGGDEGRHGVMRPQAKEILGTPEAGRSKEGSSLEESEGVHSCQGLGLDLPSLQNCETRIAAVLSRPVCGSLLQQRQETYTDLEFYIVFT